MKTSADVWSPEFMKLSHLYTRLQFICTLGYGSHKGREDKSALLCWAVGIHWAPGSKANSTFLRPRRAFTSVWPKFQATDSKPGTLWVMVHFWCITDSLRSFIPINLQYVWSMFDICGKIWEPRRLMPVKFWYLEFKYFGN